MSETSSPLTDLAEARERILGQIDPRPTREYVLVSQARGRVLARDLAAPADRPAFANSAMDGFALRTADRETQPDGPQRLVIAGTAYPGHPYEGTLPAQHCVRIATGAMLPAGADAVIMREHVTEIESGSAIVFERPVRSGDHIRLPGEDVRRGEPALMAGTRLDPRHIAFLAALGEVEVPVYPQPRVGFFSTGDELEPLGHPLQPGAIYDSNRYLLSGLIEGAGMEAVDLGRVPDDAEALREVLVEAGRDFDALISTGGVSVGDVDFVTAGLRETGTLSLWRIAMKPGKPLAFGQLQRAWFFGLPGNPVSVFATFLQIVAPALERLGGAEPQVPVTLTAELLEDLAKSPGRIDFQRGLMAPRPDSTGWTVRSSGPQGSHRLSSFVHANCFIILPADWGKVSAGTAVTVQPFTGLL